MMDCYRRVKEIGKGAYGKAILVEDKRTGEKKVVKEMDMQKLPIESQAACRDEVKLLARLQHRNVVKYYDSFEERGKLCIVMEYCDGGDLEEKINPKNKGTPPLTEHKIWDYFVQLCLALKYLHGKKVLHRDLKPSNIFLTSKGEVKLGDFGVSKSLAHTLDLATTFAGTPVYISPEVVNNQPYNDKSDVWSLGCVLYEMATGELPFLTGNLIALGFMIMRSPHKPLPATFSLELRLLVDELLRKSPIARPSVAEILQKPAVKTVARRFLSDREAARDIGGPRLPAGIAVSPLELSSPEDAVMRMRLRRVNGQAKRADQEDGAKSKQAPEPKLGHKPRIRVMKMYEASPHFIPPSPPPTLRRLDPLDSLLLYRHELDRDQLRMDSPPRGAAAAPAVDRSSKPAPPPAVDRSSKPAVPPSPPALTAAYLLSSAVPAAAPSAVPPAAAAESTAAAPKSKTLYEELLELGDDFDINNLDFSGEKYFKDEIDQQEQARKAENTPLIDLDDMPPAYDQLPSTLRRHPDEGQHVKYDNEVTFTTAEAHALGEEVLALGYIKPDNCSIPDLDDDDDGPENFSHLFSLPSEDTKDKDLTLYDELLALALHNREQQLAGFAQD